MKSKDDDADVCSLQYVHLVTTVLDAAADVIATAARIGVREMEDVQPDAWQAGLVPAAILVSTKFRNFN